MNADYLIEVEFGDTISADQWNLMIHLLKRNVTGRGIMEGSTGWDIKPQVFSDSIKFGIVKNAAKDSLLPFIDMLEVAMLEELPWEGDYTVISDQIETINCYPGNVQDDFFPLNSDREFEQLIRPQDQVQLLLSSGGVWFCMPYAKRKRENIVVEDRLRFSDCLISA